MDVDPRTRGARCDELIDALTACWGPDPVSLRGPVLHDPGGRGAAQAGAAAAAPAAVRHALRGRAAPHRGEVRHLEPGLGHARAAPRDLRAAGRDATRRTRSRCELYRRLFTTPPVRGREPAHRVGGRPLRRGRRAPASRARSRRSSSTPTSTRRSTPRSAGPTCRARWRRFSTPRPADGVPTRAAGDRRPLASGVPLRRLEVQPLLQQVVEVADLALLVHPEADAAACGSCAAPSARPRG